MKRHAGVPLVTLLFGIAAGAACSTSQEDLTQIMVVVDTDFRVPEELDGVRIRVTGPGGESSAPREDLQDDTVLPFTLGILHAGGPLGDVEVTVTGSLGSEDVVQRRARMAFVRNRVVTLQMNLLKRCQDVSCGDDETCGEEGCRPEEISPAELVGWTGAPPRLQAEDAGAPDRSDAGTGCIPLPESCNERDDDCDGEKDEDFDLSGDPENCGQCGNVCPNNPPNASSVCLQGQCSLNCDPGWGDCDDEADNGCEQLLALADSCGACGASCTGATPLCAGGPLAGYDCVDSCPETFPDRCEASCVNTETDWLFCGRCDNVCPAPENALPACNQGECSFACDSGRGDCDSAADNGCESTLRDLEHCGACNTPCDLPDAVESCSTGTCEIVACSDLREDCDGFSANGCEIDPGTDQHHCGSCGNSCPAAGENQVSACVDGNCSAECIPGFDDCDGDPANGCETSLGSSTSCGSCGVACDDPTPLCMGNPIDGFSCIRDCGSETPCGQSCVDTQTNLLHCGACDTPCVRENAVVACNGGTCTIDSCKAGFENCDGDDTNGCETDINGDAAHCGACGNACLTSGGGPYVTSVYCNNGNCMIDGCETNRGDCNGLFGDGCESDLLFDKFHCGDCSIGCVYICCDGECLPFGPPFCR